MSTSTIGQYFSNRVEELISEFTGHTLIFFKGFGLEQIRFLITHPNSLLDLFVLTILKNLSGWQQAENIPMVCCKAFKNIIVITSDFSRHSFLPT